MIFRSPIDLILSKEDAEANFGAIVNALHGTDLPTYFKEIKNPLEPFLGVSLDNHNIEHPFGSNFQEIFRYRTL